jgi:lysophospholipid acyltransferase (LPLAT)-like uncharacterized protein
MKGRFEYFLYHTLFPQVGVFLVRLLSCTYRLRLVETQNERACLEKDGSVIYASWHQRFFPGVTFFAMRRPIAILISQRRDGEFAARIVDILGWRAVRGSSHRGGHEGLEQLKALSRKGYKIGHIVDGPKGPFGEIKPGLLRIAQVSGLGIVPTITSSERRWAFRSWDRFMVPSRFPGHHQLERRSMSSQSREEGFERRAAHRAADEGDLRDTDRIGPTRKCAQHLPQRGVSSVYHAKIECGSPPLRKWIYGNPVPLFFFSQHESARPGANNRTAPGIARAEPTFPSCTASP